MPKELIEHTIFPLGDFESKDEIRKIAKENNLKVANKPDSEDICFVPDGNYKKFLQNNSNLKGISGNIVLQSGEIIGKHEGLINYTIGQRKGLGISYKEPLYVIKLNKEKNELVVGTEKELYLNELYADEINYLVDPNKWEGQLSAKIRYKSKNAKVKVEILNNKKLHVLFEEPQRAITKGQSVVIYDDENIVLRWRKNIIKIL